LFINTVRVAHTVTVNGNRDRRGGSGDDRNSRNSRNRDNSDGSGRNSVDWEVEWMKGMDSEGMMLATVGLGTEVTAEGI
jgi:hypothetical protein